MPQILKRICAFLRKANVQLPGQSRDGRMDSSTNEKPVIDLLVGKFSSTIMVPSKPRHWYDFAVADGGVLVPVNIKITALRGAADNLNCKLGIYYALTGKEPTFANGIPWGKFHKVLMDNITPNDRDYYFLVINKRKPSELFAIGLKEIAVLQPNGNNLPFQCCWRNNRVPKQRSFAAAKSYIIKQLRASHGLRTLASEQFSSRLVDLED